ncbi:D-alanyl-D-alanine carboxypeptidase family protein [Monashia sp. NPDC004114]
MTTADRSQRRPWTIPVAGALLSATALGLSVTTAGAAEPAMAPGVASAGAPAVAPAGSPAVAPAAAPAAGPTCAPWQTPTVVPPGVVLTPRVFPSAEPTTPTTAPVTPKATVTPPPRPGAPIKPARPAKPRTVCRNAPPTPFAHPAWAADTVVGGSRLGSTGVVVDARPGVPAPPDVFDVSYVIADLGTGEILAAKSPHAWLRPASTLKTLTALTLMPRLDPRTVVRASADAQNAEGSRVGIIAGNPYPVHSLFDAMLMFSANDAVYTLADAAGGYDRTVALMNETTQQIGAFDTVVVDPSGLDEGNQRSSAYDLALIARQAMLLPEFRSTIVKRDAVFPGGKDVSGKVWKPFHIYNINDLLRHYQGAVGIKPGRTDRAQHTFIGAATRGGRTLLVAQMGSVTGSWKPTAALLDWGFANAGRVTPVGRLVSPGEATPPSATTATAVKPSAGPATPAAGITTPPPSSVELAVASIAGSGRESVLLVGGGALAVLLVAIATIMGVRRARRRSDGSST